VIDEHAWITVKLIFVTVDLCMGIRHLLGRVPPWVRRNSSRFATLLFGAGVFIESDWKRMNAFVFLLGLITWNLPRDSEPPKRRRRREQERKEEKSPPNWSGLPENA
jgi:hypothetical protein